MAKPKVKYEFDGTIETFRRLHYEFIKEHNVRVGDVVTVISGVKRGTGWNGRWSRENDVFHKNGRVCIITDIIDTWNGIYIQLNSYYRLPFYALLKMEVNRENIDIILEKKVDYDILQTIKKLSFVKKKLLLNLLTCNVRFTSQDILDIAEYISFAAKEAKGGNSR